MEKPLQAREELLSANVLLGIGLESMQFGDKGKYVDFLESEYVDSPVFDHLVQLANFAKSSTGDGDQEQARRAAVRGGVIAIRVAELARGPELLAAMPSAGLLIPARLQWNEGHSLLEKLERAEQMSDAIVQAAVAEYSTAEPFHELLTAWELEVVGDEDHATFYCAGFGIMTYFARRAIEKSDTAAMAKVAAQLDAGVPPPDWDTMPWGS